jgi:siroheme synthase-like protein
MSSENQHVPKAKSADTPRPGLPYYLAALDLRGRRCLVAGAGSIARRKDEGLLAAGASVVVVAPEIASLPAGAVGERRAVRPADLDGAVLCICATDDATVNASLAAEARARGIWVNVVDDPAAGTFTVPATLSRGTLQIGISTGGASPALAASLRRQLSQQIGAEYGLLVALLGDLRRTWEPRALAAGLAPAARQAAWQAVLALPLITLLRSGDEDEARAQALATLETALTTTPDDG